MWSSGRGVRVCYLAFYGSVVSSNWLASQIGEYCNSNILNLRRSLKTTSSCMDYLKTKRLWLKPKSHLKTKPKAKPKVKRKEFAFTKKNVKFTKNEMCKSILLMYSSFKTYNLLRKMELLKLPAPSTIRSHIQKYRLGCQNFY